MYDYRAAGVSPPLRQLTAAERLALAPHPAKAKRLLDTGRIQCDRCPAPAQLSCHAPGDTSAVCHGCYVPWLADRRIATRNAVRRMLVGFLAASTPSCSVEAANDPHPQRGDGERSLAGGAR
jgi:hypothetical protein